VSILLDGLTVQQAAARIGVGRARVQAMIMRNELAAEMVGGRWVVPVEEALRAGRIPREAGHPLDEATAWRIIGEFEDGRRRAGDLPPMWGALVARATSFIGWVLPEHVDVAGCPIEVRIGGNRRASDLGAAVTTLPPHDVYLLGSTFAEFVDWAGFRRVAGSPNIRLHLVSAPTWHDLSGGVPLAACWLDLADAGERGASEVLFDLRDRHGV
jgi:excisionase family DNA binding protein